MLLKSVFSTPRRNRNNSRYGAELATMQLNEAGGVQRHTDTTNRSRYTDATFRKRGYKRYGICPSKLALELILEEEGIRNRWSQPFNLCRGCRGNCAKARHTDDGNLCHQSVCYCCG